jgi:hypothetical protein
VIEITNKQRTPVQLVVKSKKRPRWMTCLNVPGIGSGNNVRYLPDELVSDYVKRAEEKKQITTKYIPNSEFKGE